MVMRVRSVSLSILFAGLGLLVIGFFLPGNPDAPLALGGIPLPFYTGIGAGYVVGGALALVINHRSNSIAFERVFFASLLSIPVALSAALILEFLNGIEVTTVVRFLAVHAGLAILFYPITFGLLFGYDLEHRDRILVGIIAAMVLTGLIVLMIFSPQGGFAGAVFFLSFWVIVITDAVFAYPLYRVGLVLRPESPESELQ